MKIFVKITLFSALLFLSACTVRAYENNEYISLQHLGRRDVVTCVDHWYKSSIKCAAEYEQDGYIRLSEKTRRSANYDYVKEGHYPERKWREGDFAPRW